MIIQWKKYMFKINDIYGSPVEKEMAQADVHAYFQQNDFIESDAILSIHKRVKTLCIDLYKTEEELRKDMNKSTRYQINKASRDNLRIEHLTAPTTKETLEFIEFFNSFAKEKGIELCREDKVKSLKENNNLIISNVYHENGSKLVSHLYMADGSRATMLYSCSGRFTETDIPHREVGRANRYLHWQDILFLKEENYKVYDFLGLSRDKDDKAQQNINDFKKGFGGRVEINYQSIIPQTKKGLLMILLLKFRWRNQLERVVKGRTIRERGV